MKPSLTVVLPVHNAEASLRRDTYAVVEACSELTGRFELLILDDGSTDDTYEVANELAAEYRQIRVTRRSKRAGLGEALETIRRRIKSDVVIVHDGASRVNAEQLRLVWKQQTLAARGGAQPDAGVSFADLRRPGQTHAAMAEAHRRLMGFQRITVDASAEESPTAPLDKPQERRDGVGSIPPLPRPNLLSALTAFALNE
ncbi:Beta-monoglucosyldiacylglycerol synthase [Pseudobythopirellula maris]|uniref:Beta-monoglucosyldiacylglycerol synthase n=1 Tax=Pseudobythopirellula maris TaxID=2527991 RepID=A0A5C5ZR19_9BACT|nr:glycosyltransferase [Pseudobythopirellula maris]TWT88753.1 Beta-monoglucosyldiacylglycerol synthase [Pseudobythopirellula maris]